MRKIFGLALLGLCCAVLIVSAAWAELPLKVVYPPSQHTTLAKQIFLIGTAPQLGTVTVNGQPIARSPAGHFAPSFPLQIGENVFKLQYQDQRVQINVTRQSTVPAIPVDLGFIPKSLTPTVNIARLPGELICFTAIAVSHATISVTLANQTVALTPEAATANLPKGESVLTGQPEAPTIASGRYRGCTQFSVPGNLGKPHYQITVNGNRQTATAAGEITILATAQAAEVKATVGVARVGPSIEHSRLTPLPQGTQASITGAEGDWLRLDYGAWIKREEVKILPSLAPPRSLIHGISSDRQGDWTEIRFPLQVPVPVSVQQDKNRFILTLHNTTAQTDTIRFKDLSLISGFDWQQVDPAKVEYRFTLTTQQQWGYKLRYAGTTLILSLRHPPIGKSSQPVAAPGKLPINALAGVKILLDAGHGGPEDLGARGPTGYPEKDVTLAMAKLLRQELRSRGATVYLSREQDLDVSLADRVQQLNQIEPTLYLSLHYNALPDDGDAIATQGVSTFWFTPQSHDLAVFLHNYLVHQADRPSYGVFWKSLAVARPTTAPAVLLELGFMINPIEFEWIINPQEQQKLAKILADGITQWLLQTR